MPISRDVFDRERRPRFGTANPEPMRMAFWEWMIRGDDRPPPTDNPILGDLGLMVRGGVLKSGYGPWRARDLFGVPPDRADGPIWTFDRMGATQTPLPDGRVVCVGGEHEDFYDPDFCIYNDVIVLGPADQIEIYGYPRDVFPPTDFHTATRVADRIIVIGCLGYPDDRRPGHTPVYALDLADYRITAVPTTGDMPGWVFKHEAAADPDGTIRVQGGEVFEGGCRIRRNLDEYALDLRSRTWLRLTDRNWFQFQVRQTDRQLFVLERGVRPAQLLPRGVACTVLSCDEWGSEARITIREVPVSVTADIDAVTVIIEGQLPGDLALRVVEEIRANTETAAGVPCVVE